MTSKIVSYDLCSPGRNYNELYEAIRKYPQWAHITGSTWFVKSDSSCVEVRANLSKYMDNNDRIFVAELTGNAAWENVICDNDYLKRNL